ncbi:uncharacterized protein [Rutidosis leptorrhynchoides]|uniref:uncharacterized protein n=1 Tax=Rutidosis leptorrhynchoides TaxID=125765 RepID=UPI003A99CDFC
MLHGETTILSRFRHGDIVRATENFAEKYRVWLDAYHKVYKAELDQFESKTVAIKLISARKDGQEKQDFLVEIVLRTRYKNPNIASLLGFCDKGPEMILVYEHGSNGSLNDYLRSNHVTRNKLTWKVRLQICLEIARGLNHLHTKMDNEKGIIHGDIRSANILLVNKLETKLEAELELVAKIAYFGVNPLTNNGIDTKVYRDPEYERTGKLEIESDIYAFGVVLFEIFCGRLAYDSYYIVENDKGLAPIACRCFIKGTMMEIMDPILSEEEEETDVFSTTKGPNKDSLYAFLKIAYECMRKDRAKRPRMETVIKELEKVVDFQENLMNNLEISLEDINFATQNFSQENCVGEGRDWKAYKGKLPHAKADVDVKDDANANIRKAIVAKRWNSKSGEGDRQFRTELDILLKLKHENITGLEGYCNKMNQTIIVYQDVPDSSLNMYLSDASLNWMKRLEICIAVATGLEFFHKRDVTLKRVALRDIKSSSILLNVDWKAGSKVNPKNNWRAKISLLDMSLLDSLEFDTEHVSNDAYGYLDPEYVKRGSLTEKSVIYSLGVILFEILCGRLAWVDGYVDHSESLVPFAKRHYVQGKLDEMVFKGLKKQIVPKSLTTFANIAYRCLCDDGDERPEAAEVVKQLKEALEFQEEDEIWEPQLPRNYREIIAMLDSPEIYTSMRKKELYNLLSEGIFIQKEKVWLSLSSTGQVNTFISPTTFSYGDHRSHKCKSIQKSITRFPRVVKMMDITNLKIQIKINTDVLWGSFGLQIDDESGWMTIELFQFIKKKQDTVFEVSLESFSRCYCSSRSIYVQGVEFKAIDKVRLRILVIWFPL